MLEHTKKHRIKNPPLNEDTISAERFTSEVCEERPFQAVYLSGLRNRDGLTQKQLGELISVSQYNISKMERGHRPIGKTIAQRLAKVFKTDYRNFL